LGLLQGQGDTNGFFVDLAANHAFSLSNTYSLEQQPYGWTGICVEPNPRYWSNLAKRKCHVAAAVVSKERMQAVQFHMFDDRSARAASGGIVDLVPQRIAQYTKDKPVTLYTVPIAEILQNYRAPVVMEYLSLDVEGAEFLVMKDFPFDKYKFKIMTVERPTQDVMDLLYANRYVYIAANNEWGQETLFVHRDYMHGMNLAAVEQVGWRGTTTRWIQVNESGDGKPPKVLGLTDLK
jgi:FkbM family methyltransferase